MGIEFKFNVFLILVVGSKLVFLFLVFRGVWKKVLVFGGFFRWGRNLFWMLSLNM